MAKILVSRPFGQRDPKEGEPDFEEFEATPAPKVHTREQKEEPASKQPAEKWPTAFSERRKGKSPLGVYE